MVSTPRSNIRALISRIGFSGIRYAVILEHEYSIDPKEEFIATFSGLYQFTVGIVLTILTLIPYRV